MTPGDQGKQMKHDAQYVVIGLRGYSIGFSSELSCFLFHSDVV